MCCLSLCLVVLFSLISILLFVPKNPSTVSINSPKISFLFSFFLFIFLEKSESCFPKRESVVGKSFKNLSSEKFITYHQNLQKNHIKFLSIQHTIIDKNFTKIFSDITLFAWTVNDLARLRDLQKIGVKNFTSDIITPQML